mmetsp:Transcript_1170/g.1167  ORF Transcript_1170/g.1167 Transcript_1170/m.1167 type:complete len:122 (+) Transcript_1170:1200-1565(+)
MMFLVFWNLGTDIESINGKSGFLFFIGINTVMSTLFSVLLTFLMERPVFLREYASKMYGVTPYFLSKSVVETPFQAGMPFLLSLITYFAVGLTVHAGKFFLFVVILIMNVFCATSFALFVG